MSNSLLFRFKECDESCVPSIKPLNYLCTISMRLRDTTSSLGLSESALLFSSRLIKVRLLILLGRGVYLETLSFTLLDD